MSARTDAVRMAATFGPVYPYKHARQSGALSMTAVIAARAIMRGDADYALKVLREALEDHDPFWADHVWPDAVEMEKAA